MKQPVGDTAYMTEHMRYLFRLPDDPPIHLASTPLGAHRGEGGYPPQKKKKQTKIDPLGCPPGGYPPQKRKKSKTINPLGCPPGGVCWPNRQPLRKPDKIEVLM